MADISWFDMKLVSTDDVSVRELDGEPDRFVLEAGCESLRLEPGEMKLFAVAMADMAQAKNWKTHNQPRCATCKHWMEHGSPMLHICRLATTNDGRKDDRESTAWACDDESYHAHLVTEPTFGCVQHEPKETP